MFKIPAKPTLFQEITYKYCKRFYGTLRREYSFKESPQLEICLSVVIYEPEKNPVYSFNLCLICHKPS